MGNRRQRLSTVLALILSSWATAQVPIQEGGREAAGAPGQPRLCVFDLSSVLEKSVNGLAAPGTRLDLSNLAERARTDREDLQRCASLVLLFERILMSESFGPGEQLKPAGTTHMAGLLRSANEKRLRGILETLKAERALNTLYDAQARVLAVPKAAFRERLASLPASTRHARGLVMEPGGPKTGAFLRWLLAGEDVRTLATPRILLEPGKVVSLKATTKKAYVKDYKLQKLLNGTVICDPIVDTVEKGVVAVARLLPIDANRLGLQLRLSNADLTEPIATFSTTLGGGAPVKIQLPEITAHSVKTSLVLPRNGYIVLTIGQLGGEYRVLVLHVRQVEMPTAPTKDK